MSVSMSIQIFSENRKTKRQLARAMNAVWPSAEAMAIDLQEIGIIRDPRTCQNWRKGTTEPRHSEAEAIKRLIREIGEQKIAALQQLIYGVSPCGDN